MLRGCAPCWPSFRRSTWRVRCACTGTVARVLDASEVSAIVASAERERARLGIVQRDAHGVPALDERATWSTYYLHTGGWLTREHPELVAKLWRAAVAADRAEGWRLLSRADERETAPPVTVRTAELTRSRAEAPRRPAAL